MILKDTNILKKNESKSIVVLYGTKYGSTKQYAEWIAKAVGAAIFEMSAFQQSALKDYAVVIFGTPIYMGRLKHRSFLKCNWDILSTKRLVVFGVSGLTSADPRQYKAFQASLPLHIRKKVTYYPLRGAFNYLKLDCIDKIFMSGPRIRFQINYWIKRNKEAREALSRFFSPHDWTDKSTTDPIVTFIERQLQQSMGAIDMSRNDQ